MTVVLFLVAHPDTSVSSTLIPLVHTPLHLFFLTTAWRIQPPVFQNYLNLLESIKGDVYEVKPDFICPYSFWYSCLIKIDSSDSPANLAVLINNRVADAIARFLELLQRMAEYEVVWTKSFLISFIVTRVNNPDSTFAIFLHYFNR